MLQEATEIELLTQFALDLAQEYFVTSEISPLFFHNLYGTLRLDPKSFFG